MKRHLVLSCALAIGSLGVLPLFAGSAGASVPPLDPPGVVNQPSASSTAVYAVTQACGSITTKNPVALQSVPNQPVVGTAAFEERGDLFCGI